MKKLIILFGFSIFCASAAFGQMHDRFFWMDAGLKVQYGAAGLLNKAISDSPTWNYDVGKTFAYGAKLGLNKGSAGLSIDVMRAQTSQPFENAAFGDPEVTWKSLDLYTLFRSNAQLAYFELGPKFSFINEVTSTNGAGDASDITDGFTSNEISGVIGFGAYFIGSGGRFSGVLGLRFEYGLTDMNNEASATANGYPTQDVNLYATGYTKSNPVIASIVFELNWGIGYYGKASCGGRGKFIMI